MVCSLLAVSVGSARSKLISVSSMEASREVCPDGGDVLDGGDSVVTWRVDVEVSAFSMLMMILL